MENAELGATEGPWNFPERMDEECRDRGTQQEDRGTVGDYGRIRGTVGGLPWEQVSGRIPETGLENTGRRLRENTREK